MELELASGVALGRFDYSKLDPDQQRVARDAALFIASKQRGMATAVLEIGARLIDVKAALGHGHFVAWVESSFSMNIRTAQNYMAAAAALGDKSETVSYLPVATVYEIARAPEPIRAKVMEELETASEPLSATRVQGLLWEANEKAKAEAIEAKKTPKQRKNDKARRAKWEKANREADLANGRRKAKEERAMVRLAELLIEKLGPGIKEAADMFTDMNATDFARRLAGDLYGTKYVGGEVMALTKDEWLAYLERLERGERR